MIEIRNLKVDKNGLTICDVQQLSISSGERISVIGANGSGKTTLLRVMAGFERDYTGGCRVDCRSSNRVFVHQAPYLFRGTVRSNIAYGVSAHGLQRDIEQWSERFGLLGILDQLASNLSAGERRRVALVRAMILQPSLLLLDEPLADLDEAGAEAAIAAMNDLSDTTVVIAAPTALGEGIVERTVQL